jgi:hypothetical protein
MFFQNLDGGAPAISQAEINRVVQSIRKLPAGENANGGAQD